MQILALQDYNLLIYFLPDIPDIPDIPDDCFCSVFCLHVNIFQELKKQSFSLGAGCFFTFLRKWSKIEKKVLK